MINNLSNKELLKELENRKNNTLLELIDENNDFRMSYLQMRLSKIENAILEIKR